MSNNHYAFSGNPNAQSYSDPYSHQGYSNHPSGPYQDHDGNQGPTSAFSPHHDQDVSEMDNVTRQRTRPQSDAFDEKSVHQHNNYGSGPGMAAGGTYGGSSQRNSIWSADDKHVFFRRSVPARIFRSIFCIVIWTIIIIISVILLVVTFAKPPNVAVMSIAVPDGNDFSVSGTSFKANGSVNFAVSNPNSFSATIEHLQAHLYDANLGKSVSVGNGTLQSQKIKANDNTTIVFPFDIGIDLASDATELISDVASQCGLTDLVNSLKGRDEAGLTSDDVAVLQARASNQLTVLLDIDARVSILSVGISVPVSKNITIDCPTAALQSVLGSLTGGSGGASSALSGILGGGRKRREIEHDAL